MARAAGNRRRDRASALRDIYIRRFRALGRRAELLPPGNPAPATRRPSRAGPCSGARHHLANAPADDGADCDPTNLEAGLNSPPPSSILPRRTHIIVSQEPEHPSPQRGYIAADPTKL